MSLHDLIRLYGETLRGLTHTEYSELVRQTMSSGPAAESAIARAKRDPETRFTNVLNHRVLQYLHQMETGAGSEVNQSGLQLF